MELRIALDQVRERVRTHGMTATLQDFACRAVNHVAFFQILKGMAVRLTDVRDARLFEAPGLDARFANPFVFPAAQNFLVAGASRQPARHAV